MSNIKGCYCSDGAPLACAFEQKLEERDLVLFHVQEITFEEKAPRKEALENVLSALQIDGIHFVYLLYGDETGVRFYFGLARDLVDPAEAIPSPRTLGETVLRPSLEGNFRGSRVTEILPDEKRNLREKLDRFQRISFLEGVPGITEDHEKFQSVDRLTDVMLGQHFAMMILAKPLNFTEIQSIEEQLYNMYSHLAPLAKQNIQSGFNQGQGTSTNHTESTNESSSTSESHTDQTSSGSTKSETTGSSSGSSASETTGKQTSQSKNHSSGNDSSSESGGESFSSQKGTNQGSSRSETEGTSRSEGVSDTKGESRGKSWGASDSSGESKSSGSSAATSIEIVDKQVQDWIAYLDNVAFKRLDYGKGKGLFVSSIVLFSDSVGNMTKLENTIRALYSGESGNKFPFHLMELDSGDKAARAFRNFQIPSLSQKTSMELELPFRTSLSQYVRPQIIYLGNWISTNELSMIAGLPQKEVVGLQLLEQVDFGLNPPSAGEDAIALGHLVQSGRTLDKISVSIDKAVLDKHVFVTGVTGSGKTTTCQRLLAESGLPFLVIEPAKTEYRELAGRYDDLLVFTLGKDTVAPFRLNPFEFMCGESITSRVDMIKASIEASADMEAAIPQLIESALYSCYEDCGWEIATNKNREYHDPFGDGVYPFPTLSMLLDKIPEIVNAQGFDERLKNDYIGSIRARLNGLVLGAKGLMLDTRRSIDFVDLLNRRVVLELEEIRSESEKSLIMGWILTSLTEAIKYQHARNPAFRHITLVEEAHRLLSRFSAGDSANKKQSVETFSNLLAEVRKYGESLMIVDQIPSKLTPEVMKNTNTKIVHRLFAADDKEAVGSAMALTKEQAEFLSHLPAGHAVILSGDWPRAVRAKMKMLNNPHTSVSEKELRGRVIQYYCPNYRRGIFPGTARLLEQPTEEQFEKYMEFPSDREVNRVFRGCFSKGMSGRPRDVKPLRELLVTYREQMTDFMSLLLQSNYDDTPERREDLRQFLELVSIKETLTPTEQMYFRDRLSDWKGVS